jgi:enolase
MDRRIAAMRALEILDSRGNPTVRVEIGLADGTTASASVPSGASTGINEAAELRDGDKTRYGGRGVRRAVAAVNEVLAPALAGHDPTHQAAIDAQLIALDGTANKGRLGANALLGASMAVARAAASAVGLPLYTCLGGAGARRLPVPMMNVLNGGRHADTNVDFQEFMIVPVGAASYGEALRWGAETFQALKSLLQRRGLSTAVGDEGGFAPDLKSNEEACALLVEAITAAGYRPGPDVALALDPAASEFHENGVYELAKSGQGRKSSAELTDLYESWLDRFPIVSIEDGLGETDWDGFRAQTTRLGSRVQLVGDDLYVTNPVFIGRGIAEKATNAVLIKLNQIGTVTETVAAIELCRKAGWGFVVSHRSGETEDPFIADFAVAMGGGQIKCGSLSRSERIAKYNRLLEIEAELGAAAVFQNPFAAG